MKWTEILLWDALYWALYAPTTFIIYAITGQGDLLGIFIIGFVITLLLSVFLAAWNNEKTVEVYTYDEKQEENPRPEPSSSARLEVGFEPGVPMRTDVNLGSLDADDDDNISDRISNTTD